MDQPMYGTVARMHVKPGAEAALMKLTDETSPQIPGFVAHYVYRMENEPDVYYLVVVFKDKAAYVANAQSPEQHDRYKQYLEHLQGEPEWHDGPIVSTLTMQ